MSLLLDIVLFLRSTGTTFKLTPLQKLILYTVAGRIGKNKNCWIQQRELAKECELSMRAFQENLKILVDHKIIIIDKITTKKGKQNVYNLHEGLSTFTRDGAYSVQGTTCAVARIVPPPLRAVARYPKCAVARVVAEEKSLAAPVVVEENQLEVPPKETIERNNKAKEKSIVHFDEFWEVYPRKADKDKARKKWSTLKCDTFFDDIIRNVKARNATQWLGKEKQFILLPTTYLNGKRWLDEPEEGANEIHQRPNGLNRRQASMQRVLDHFKH